MSQHPQRLPVFVLVLSSIAWGCTWWPLKYFADAGISGVALIFLAYGSVALVLLPVLFMQFAQWRHEARIMLMIFGIGGYASIAFNIAVMYGDVVRCMALFYTLPVWAVLGGRVFLQERITVLRGLSVVIAIGGAWLILGGAAMFDKPPSWPDILSITSGFAFAMNNLCFRAAHTSPVAPKVAVMFLGCTTFAVVLLVAGVQTLPYALPKELWLLASAFGLFWLLLANTGTQWAVTNLEAGRAAVIIILELVTAIITAAWWNDEHLSMIEWYGAGLIMVAALMEAKGTQPEKT